jgi:hypothetical protein
VIDAARRQGLRWNGRTVVGHDALQYEHCTAEGSIFTGAPRPAGAPAPRWLPARGPPSTRRAIVRESAGAYGGRRLAGLSSPHRAARHGQLVGQLILLQRHSRMRAGHSIDRTGGDSRDPGARAAPRARTEGAAAADLSTAYFRRPTTGPPARSSSHRRTSRGLQRSWELLDAGCQ